MCTSPKEGPPFHSGLYGSSLLEGDWRVGWVDLLERGNSTVTARRNNLQGAFKTLQVLSVPGQSTV